MSLPLRLGNLSRYLAIVTFVLAPLPFGSVETGWSTSWLLLLSFSLLLSPPSSTDRSDLAIMLGTVMLIVIAVALAIYQVWPNPPIGTPDPVWEALRELTDIPAQPRISATLSNPLIALGPVLLAGLAFLRAYVLCRNEREARTLIWALAWAGLIYACYGILSSLADSPWLLWREKTAYQHILTATFVNRNTAATYLGSCSLIWLLCGCREWERNAPRNYVFLHEVLDWLTSRGSLRFHLCAAGALGCLGATIMTGSRGGLISTLVVGASCVGLFFRGVAERVKIGWVGAAGLGAALLLATELLGGGIAGRLEREGIEDSGRREVYRASLDIISDHPWFGIGLGNFEAVFPRYRPESLIQPGVWDKAHSTWIQLAVEMGLPFALLTACFGIALAALLLKGAIKRRNGRHLPLIGLGVGLIGVIHSSVDFSLQIPGYAVVFCAVVGCGVAQRNRAVQRDVQDRGSFPLHPATQEVLTKPGGRAERFRH